MRGSKAEGGGSVNASNHFDAWSLIVIVLTLGLFLIALFTKGLTHDLLLEAGVFLVSVKLILVGYKNSAANGSIQQRLDDIYAAVQDLRPIHGTASGIQERGSRTDGAQSLGESSN